MSNLIKLLPDHIANQIAAGEVVQRPSSVVKELIENAIDAGATKIQVIIKDAGKTLIQLIDDGKGMSPEDARMCFERHATSKVTTIDDVFRIQTKGFRGEALASIAAIAHVTLRTKQAADETGTCIEIEGNTIGKNEPVVCSKGTSFEVKNLFYNVPARRNFLKSDTIEFNHITDEFERVALAHPDLDFQLIHNDNEVYNLSSAVLRKRIIDILGKQANERLVPVEELTDIVQIRGFIGKPEYAKRSRGEQFLFVNDRFFKDSYFNHAINKALDGLIQPKFFPSYFIYLTVDPSKIDVNVHPTKTEIKFEEDKFIYSILFSTIRQAIGKYNVAPTLDFDREMSFDLPHEMRNQPAVEPVIKVNPSYNPFVTNQTINTGGSGVRSAYTPALNASGFGNSPISEKDWQTFYKIEEEDSQPEQQQLDIDSELSYKGILVKGPYIFTSSKSGLMLIHSGRAMERIIYDELFSKFISNPVDSQQLLFPIERECSTNEQQQWLANETLLNRLGFSSNWKDRQLELMAIPACLEEESIHGCLDLIFENISFQEIDKGEIAHILIQSIAQAAGRKKFDLSKEERIRDLINQLFGCSEHALTPTGKKIIQTLDLSQLTSGF